MALFKYGFTSSVVNAQPVDSNVLSTSSVDINADINTELTEETPRKKPEDNFKQN